MKNLPALAVAAGTLALYAGVVAFGVWRGPKVLPDFDASAPKPKAWRMGRVGAADRGRVEEIEYGQLLFNETPVYAPEFVKGRVSCRNCHLEGGIAPYGLAVVGSVAAYPRYSVRARRTITLEDRIEECMTRSENGLPLPSDSREMKAMLAYIGWLSEPHREEAAFVGRGLEALPPLNADAMHGAQVYASQCAGCHGVNGEGARRPFPPLWGAESFNDGAGMNTTQKMAAFVHYNMPHNRKGILSPQDAFDVAGFIQKQPRPAFDHRYDKF